MLYCYYSLPSPAANHVEQTSQQVHAHDAASGEEHVRQGAEVGIEIGEPLKEVRTHVELLMHEVSSKAAHGQPINRAALQLHACKAQQKSRRADDHERIGIGKERVDHVGSGGLRGQRACPQQASYKHRDDQPYACQLPFAKVLSQSWRKVQSQVAPQEVKPYEGYGAKPTSEIGEEIGERRHEGIKRDEEAPQCALVGLFDKGIERGREQIKH